MATFSEMLQARWNAGARVCLGLDSQVKKLPKMTAPKERRPPEGIVEEMIEFNERVIDATYDRVIAYKPNIAFYSGEPNFILLHVLLGTIFHIRKVAPDVPIILDSKRTDIGATNDFYVSEAFEAFAADAVTVNPYFGGEALMPFLNQSDKGIIVLCRTSNPGAGEFQDRVVMVTDEEADEWGLPRGTTMPMYQLVAYRFSRKWNTNHNVALVVGATYPEELAAVRHIVGDDMWLLNPGVGKKQGGKIEPVVRNGISSRKSGIIINAGSDVLFASKETDFAEATRHEIVRMTDEINAATA